MRVAWLTDIHLNFLTPKKVDAFLAEVRDNQPEAVLIGGDIAEAHDLIDHLARIDENLQLPVYFVLGNHDFYYGSIGAVRARVEEFCQNHKRMHYLTSASACRLTESVGLVGHDGWADARIGDYERSLVSMYDYRLIDDLKGLGKSDRRNVLNRLGDEAAAHIRAVLPPALAEFRTVMLLTHVPPLREACWHEGHISDDQWAPHFTCKAMGDAILEIMREHPQRELVTLCGHTHGCGECRPLENLTILTGGAVYGSPGIEHVFELE